MQPSSAFMERIFSILRACMDERQESSYSDRIAASALLKNNKGRGIRHTVEAVSRLFLTFGFPLRLQVSLLFLNIETKAAVRDAAGSWKLGVRSNEDCFFADWSIVVLMVSGGVATDKLTWCNKWHRGTYTECHRSSLVL